MERSFQDEDYDKISFVLRSLSKEIHCLPEVIHLSRNAHLFLKYVGILENYMTPVQSVELVYTLVVKILGWFAQRSH